MGCCLLFSDFWCDSSQCMWNWISAVGSFKKLNERNAMAKNKYVRSDLSGALENWIHTISTLAVALLLFCPITAFFTSLKCHKKRSIPVNACAFQTKAVYSICMPNKWGFFICLCRAACFEPDFRSSSDFETGSNRFAVAGFTFFTFCLYFTQGFKSRQ